MNREQFESQWTQIRGNLRDKWGNLTEEDIKQINGRFDQFIAKIQQRYGLTRDEVEDQLNAWNPRGIREPAYAAEEQSSGLKWLVLAGIPLLLLAGYFLHDLTRPAERTFAKPSAITQDTAMAQDNTPDALLLNRVRQAIETNNLSPLTNITIESTNGTITIRGQVANQQEKDLISRIIERVTGVRQINNQAEIK